MSMGIDNNNNNLANNNIISKEYKHIGSNAIEVPDMDLKLNKNPKKGKFTLLNQITYEYKISSFVANKIYELKDNEAECIEYINQVIPNTHDKYPDTYAQDLFNIVHNFDVMNPDENVFKKQETPKKQEIIPAAEPVEPVEQPAPVEQTESDDDRYVRIKTENPEIDIIVSPLRKEIVIQIEKSGKINGMNLKIKGGISELLDISKNYETKITKLIITAGNIERKEAKDIANNLMCALGFMGFEKFEKMAEKAKNTYQVDLNQFCDDKIKIEMIEYAVELVNDGNTKKYVTERVGEKYNLDVKDSKYVVESASLIKEGYLNSINPLYFFNDMHQNKLNVPYLFEEISKFGHFKSIGYNGKKDIYVYIDGVYVNKGITIVQKYTNYLLKNYVKKEFRSEIIDYIGIEKNIERDNLNKYKNLINLNNGMYDIETGKLIPHDPKYNSTMRIPITYNPEAKCPNIDKFMSEVVTPENKVTLTEFVGYCLIPDVRFQRALMIFGHAGNGKSVFLNMVGKLLGKSNISGTPLQKLAHDKFAVAGLFEKLANICADIPATKLKEDGTLKMIIGADDLTNAEKKFMDQFDFMNYARLMFSANTLPEPAGDPDDNLAFFRRWMLVAFPNTFLGKKDNKKLIAELTTEEEKSGYLNKLLEALKTIFANGKFTYEKSAEENAVIYKANMASVDKFFEENVVVLNNEVMKRITKTDMYNGYKDWCNTNGAIPKFYDVFCGKLSKEKGLKSNRIGKEKVGTWMSVCWKDQYTKLNLNLNENEEIKPLDLPKQPVVLSDFMETQYDEITRPPLNLVNSSEDVKI